MFAMSSRASPSAAAAVQPPAASTSWRNSTGHCSLFLPNFSAPSHCTAWLAALTRTSRLLSLARLGSSTAVLLDNLTTKPAVLISVLLLGCSPGGCAHRCAAPGGRNRLHSLAWHVALTEFLHVGALGPPRTIMVLSDHISLCIPPRASSPRSPTPILVNLQAAHAHFTRTLQDFCRTVQERRLRLLPQLSLLQSEPDHAFSAARTCFASQSAYRGSQVYSAGELALATARSMLQEKPEVRRPNWSGAPPGAARGSSSGPPALPLAQARKAWLRPAAAGGGGQVGDLSATGSSGPVTASSLARTSLLAMLWSAF